MAYDAGKEKIIKEETVELTSETKAQAKIYTYNDGARKFKLLFIVKSRGQEIYTSKFPSLTDAGDIEKLRRLFQKFEKEPF